MVAIASSGSTVESSTTSDLVLRIASSLRLGDNELTRSALLAADCAPAATAKSPDDVVRLALERLTELLRNGDGEPAEHAHAIALMAASLSPALRRDCLVELRELARVLHGDELTPLLDSPSPHARIGARLLSGWRDQDAHSAHGTRVSSGDETVLLGPESGPSEKIPDPGSPAMGEEPPPWPRWDGGVPDIEDDQTAVLEDLRHPAVAVRRAAIAECRGRTITKPMAEALVGVVTGDPSPEARSEAVRVFDGKPKAWRLLMAESALSSRDVDVQAVALELVDGPSEEEAALTARFVVEADPTVASRAADMLARLPSTEAIALLWSALPGAHADVQQYVVRRLNAIDSSALRFNIRLALRGPAGERRIAGLVALGELDDEPITPLIESLSDPNVDVRLSALRSLSRRTDPDAMDAVGRRLLDPSPDVRGLAVAVLGKEQNPSTAPLLIGAAADPDESVRAAATEAIRSMASPEVIDQILRVLPNPATEEVACNLLGSLGEEATDALIGSAAGAAPRTRDLIGGILRRAQAGPTVSRMLCDPEPRRRRLAAEAAVAMSGKGALSKLVSLLVDPEPDVRRRTVELIGDLDDAAAADELAAARAREPDPRVIDAIDASIRRITRRAEVLTELHSIDAGGNGP